MSTDLVRQVFEERTVRVIVDSQGEPWFVLADLCALLGLQNPTMVAGRLDDDMKGVADLSQTDRHIVIGADHSIRYETNAVPVPRRPGQRVHQQANIVSEPGMYDVFMRSDSPIAKPFQDWVCRDVLPSIRKTGQYVAPWTEEQVLADAIIVAQRVLARRAERI